MAVKEEEEEEEEINLLGVAAAGVAVECVGKVLLRSVCTC